ncbi:MAG: glycine betaine ABC transporter substrate-binding protein [Solirubrobacteraceae bacterium]
MLSRPLAPPLVVALLAAVACACAGCGSAVTASSGGGRSTSARATSRASAEAKTTTSTASTRPATTGTATTGTNTSTAPPLPGTGKPTVLLGDKNYAEQFVLGQLYAQALHAQGYTVSIDQNIGPTSVTMQALKDGSLMVYPEYLGTFDTAVAGFQQPFRTLADAYSGAQTWAQAHGLVALAATPFSDSGAIAVTDGYAAANHLRSIVDLRRAATSLTIGGPQEFDVDSPGLKQLTQVYGVTPHAFKPLAVGDQYLALNAGTIQAAEVSTTDGQLDSGDYVVLRDPLHLFGWGNVVPIVSDAAVAKEGPALAITIERVDATLSTSAMRKLNQAVEIASLSPAVVAQQFLQTHNLLTPLTGRASGPA